jgi:hypothetical protein
MYSTYLGRYLGKAIGAEMERSSWVRERMACIQARHVRGQSFVTPNKKVLIT